MSETPERMTKTMSKRKDKPMTEAKTCEVFAGLMNALGWWETTKRFRLGTDAEPMRVWTRDGLLVGFWSRQGMVWPDRTIFALRTMDPTSTLENHARKVAGHRVDDAAADEILGKLYDQSPGFLEMVNASNS